jgi:hypothetical protein
MKLRKKGLLVKMAYAFKREDDIPKRTSLCKFFWRFIGHLVVVPIFFFIFFISLLVASFFGFFVAKRPTVFKNGSMVHYEKWPSVCGHRIYPISILLGIFICYVIRESVLESTSIIKESIYNNIHILKSPITLYVIIGISIIIIGLISYRMFKKSETYRLIKAYIRAKKEKVCPIIEIID